MPIGIKLTSKMGVLAGFAAVFAAGVGLGVFFGERIADKNIQSSQVALQPVPDVTVRAYRPPVRNTRPSKQEAEISEAAPTKRKEEPRQEAPDSGSRPTKILDGLASTAPRSPKSAISGRSDTWLANAVPSSVEQGRPMIAIVIDDLGIDQARTRKAIALPAPLTLAFIPYGFNLKELSAAGRNAGHELLVHVNMEPKDRGIDAGPKALLTELNGDEIRSRLHWALTRFDGFVGINNHMGSRFTEWLEGVEVVLGELRARGLLFLDSLTSQKSVGTALARAHGIPYASRDVFLDHDRTLSKIEFRLRETERIAKRRGYAIAIGHPHDMTLAALRQWIPLVKKNGLQLVPLTAIVRLRMGEG